MKLSDRALDIVADYREGQPEWIAAVQDAARAPKIHRALLDRCKGSLPPDDELRRILVRVHDPPFTDAGADGFIAEIRSTLAFAERCSSGVDTAENGNEEDAAHCDVQVGAFVQWTSQGIDRFPQPKRVLGIDGEWAFFEDSQTGVPMSELTVVDPPKRETTSPPSNPFYKPHSDEPADQSDLERMTLDEGPVKLEWPANLSPESVEEFEYWVNGLIRRAKRRAGIGAGKKDN